LRKAVLVPAGVLRVDEVVARPARRLDLREVRSRAADEPATTTVGKRLLVADGLPHQRDRERTEVR
jgi:hypothetical protein